LMQWRMGQRIGAHGFTQQS
ncbi:hypothetical protein CCACVL1_03145, partial [Corchorus capsularis]